MVLPYVEQTPLFDRFNFNVGPGDPANHVLAGTVLPVFRCPSETAHETFTFEIGRNCSKVKGPYVTWPMANYAMNWQQFELVGVDGAAKFAKVSDGLSNTIMLGERAVKHHIFGQSAILTACAVSADAWGYGAGGNVEISATVRCERISGPKEMGAPANDDLGQICLSSYHAGGAQVTLFDGHVQFIPLTIDQETLRRLADPRDGLPVGKF